MNIGMHNEQVRFGSGLNIAFALWQLASPFLLGYAGNAVALWDALLTGAAILTAAAVRMRRPNGSAVPGLVNLLVGLWLAASPFALGLTSNANAMWNDITVGLSVVVFSLAGLGLTDFAARR